MKNKIHNIHLIIGFGLLFLVPIAARINNYFGQLAQILVIGYWGIVAIIFFIHIIREVLRDYGLIRSLFNVWLFLSILTGVFGLYVLIMEGMDDAPWSVWLIIYGGLVGVIFRNELG